MSATKEKIVEKLDILPESLLQEILIFVEFLCWQTDHPQLKSLLIEQLLNPNVNGAEFKTSENRQPSKQEEVDPISPLLGTLHSEITDIGENHDQYLSIDTHHQLTRESLSNGGQVSQIN